MEKQLVAPTCSEGFEEIIHLENEDQVKGLLDNWHVPGLFTEALVQVTALREPSLVKFPRTSHLLNLGSATRDDRILSSSDIAVFTEEAPGKIVYIEEKIDGANLGISIDEQSGKIIAQNRSHFVTSQYHAQFATLDKWLFKHTAELWEILEPGRFDMIYSACSCGHSIYCYENYHSLLSFCHFNVDIYYTENGCTLNIL